VIQKPRRILENEYVFSEKWDLATMDLLKAAARIRVELDNIPGTDSDVTVEDFKAFWATSKERMSSSKSGWHFGHYRAVTEDQDLMKLHVANINLAARQRQGVPLSHWRQGVTVPLEKIAGNNRINKLRAICLLEADFNW
jgi:hypothetical protein